MRFTIYCGKRNNVCTEFCYISNKHLAISAYLIVIDRCDALVYAFVYDKDDVAVRVLKNALQHEDVLIDITKFNLYMTFGKID